MIRWRSIFVVATMIAVSTAGVTPAVATFATIDGLFSGVGPIGAGATTTLQVTGRGGVPSTGVGSVALNVTVTNPTAASFLTVWPTGTPQPTSSNLNYTPGLTVPNTVIVKVGDGGQGSRFSTMPAPQTSSLTSWDGSRQETASQD